jgi:Flp pilus assembly protein TadB
MSAILAGILPYLLGAAGIIAGLFGFGAWQRREGKMAERFKQVKAEAKARDLADEVENDVGAMTPEQRREALRKWSRR